MPEPHFSTLSDDLPRTLRRARDERDAREREANGERVPPSLKTALTAVSGSEAPPVAELAAGGTAGEGVTVTRLNVPFANLVTFFMKAVFAALPALIVLMVVLWTIGEVLQRYFPWLLKMRILIQFPG
jgi:hypothetical protein